MQYSSLDDISNDVKVCTKCELHNFRLNPVVGRINVSKEKEFGCEILFVDDFPTIEEDITGKPMVGKNGDIFNDIVFNTFNVRQEEISILHCVKCVPKYRSFRVEGSPKRESIFWCSEYLYSQIDLINPRLIISLGYLSFFVLLRNDNYFFKAKEKISLEPYVGNLYMAKSILDPKKQWLTMPCYNIKAFVSNKGRADMDLLEKMQGVYAKIRSGQDISDLLRNSPSIQ